MKRIFLLSVAALFAVSSFSQIRFGVKAGLNLPNMTLKGGGVSLDTKIGLGFHVGGIVDIPISNQLALQPGILFSTKGYKYDNDLMGKGKCNLNYIEVPVNVQYKIAVGGMKIFPFAGPYIGYGLSGKDKPDEGESYDVNFGSADEDLKALDFGLNFGAGIEFSSFQASLQYGLGLSNLSNVSDVTYKNKVIGISVAYLFGGK